MIFRFACNHLCWSRQLRPLCTADIIIHFSPGGRERAAELLVAFWHSWFIWVYHGMIRSFFFFQQWNTGIYNWYKEYWIMATIISNNQYQFFIWNMDGYHNISQWEVGESLRKMPEIHRFRIRRFRPGLGELSRGCCDLPLAGLMISWGMTVSTLHWLVVWNIAFIFPYIGNNHPNWLSYFSRWLKPPTSS